MSQQELSESTAVEDASGPMALHPEQFRLSSVELVNWGTFQGLSTLDVARKGHLITGESGSGKSSLLDGIATVLTPAKWLRYNTAAQDVGSRQGDRSLVSYVRGAWGKDEDAGEHRTRARYLRPRATWSGVALRFENGRGGVITALRVFHLKGASTDKADVKDLALVVNAAVSLAEMEPFVSTGIEARGAKAAWPESLITTTGNHGRYFARLKRLLGLGQDTALQLLHRTQAAKNLGSLDRLFRDYMLDRPLTFDHANVAVEQFVDLKEAHRLVVQAREQLEALTELDASALAFEASQVRAASARQLREALGAFEDMRRADLLRKEHERLKDRLAWASADAHEATARRGEAQEALTQANREVDQRGGNLGGRAREDLANAEDELRQVQGRFTRRAGLLEEVGIQLPGDERGFAELVASAKDTVGQPQEEARWSESPQAAELERVRSAQKELTAELALLRSTRSNLDPALLRARASIAEAVGLDPWSLPFGGELLDVRPEFREWTGAAERVLRQLSTTMLVHARDLPVVRAHVSRHHLGTLLRFEEVPQHSPSPRAVGERSLVRRVDIAAQDPAFAAWLLHRLSERFDYTCVDSEVELDGVDRGVTLTGLIKRGHRSYQKDDRSRVDDRRRWVIGSSNEAKVEDLARELEKGHARLRELTAAVDEQQRRSQRAGLLRARLAEIVGLPWEEIDVPGATRRVQRHRETVRRLSEDNPDLREALHAQAAAARAVTDAEAAQRKADGLEASLRGQESAVVGQLEATRDQLAGRELDDGDAAELTRRFAAQQRSLTLDSLPRVSRAVGNALADEERSSADAARHAEARFAEGATSFRTRFGEAAVDRTASVEDREGYRELRREIQERGLPAFEGRFRELLEGKSKEIVGTLLDELRGAGQRVRERVDPVNESLSRAPYDRDRFLRIKVIESPSAEVKAFIASLRRIVDDSWADDAAAAETRFAILDPLMMRLGSNDAADQAWRVRVLDTREHVTFLAHEVDGSGETVNVHDSSSGLSGGQRQKLVVFCLAAALRYQLAPDPDVPPRYGTVILDEAFDKADANYTRAALEVFREFGFHLVLATPQKLLSAIEPYVGAVTVVANPHRDRSLLSAVDWSGRGGAASGGVGSVTDAGGAA